MINTNIGRILLTEADCFLETLEKWHINRTGLSTNVCRYLLELEGTFDADTFNSKINSNKDILWLASLTKHKPHPFALPVWRTTKSITEIPIRIHKSDELIPDEIVNRSMHMDESAICCDIVYRTNGDSALIFSWHHLLMDGYGVVLLLKQLAQDAAAPLHHVLEEEPKERLRLTQLVNAARAKFFVDRISKKPLSTIAPDSTTATLHQKVRTIRFTPDETRQLEKIGPILGAPFGGSPVYLASAARGVESILRSKGIPVHDFWIPVPRDQRKKGSSGPLLGNHLSFLFYRLKAEDLCSLERTVRSINHQMVDQIKSKMSRDFDILMKYLRRTPTPLYYYWIKGPQGRSLASFLLTAAADHPDDFTTFAGHTIKDAWSFPPGIHPPGLNFAFMRFRESLHIMVIYFEEVISAREIEQLEKQLRYDLLTNRTKETAKF